MADWFLLCLVALFLWGVTGVTQKLSTNHVSSELSFLGFCVAFLPVGMLTLAFFPVDLGLSWGVFLLGALGGVLNGFGTLASFAAFRSGGKASVVIPIVSLYPLLTVIAARIFLNESVTSIQWLGIALAPVAAWLLSCESAPESETPAVSGPQQEDHRPPLEKLP